MTKDAQIKSLGDAMMAYQKLSHERLERILDLEEQLAKAQTAVAVVERLEAMATAHRSYCNLKMWWHRDEIYVKSFDENTLGTHKGPTLEAAVLGDGMEGEG